MMATSPALVTVSLATAVVFLLSRRYKKARTALPPGPPRWPVVGTLFSMPENNKTVETFTQWAKQYGGIVFAQVLTQKMVIIGSYEIASELLDGKSTIYSQRPRMVMAGELVGWNGSLPMLPHGPEHRRMRKLVSEGTSPRAMETLRPAQEKEQLKLLQRLASTPEDFWSHVRRASGATLLKLVYGHEVQDGNDYFLDLAEAANRSFFLAAAPGAFLVDTFPWLKYIPWASFQSKARQWRRIAEDFLEQPAAYTRKQMETDRSRACLLAKWFERAEEDKDAEQDETLMKWAALAVYGGGTDTTFATIVSFLLHMVHRPEVQAKIQAEIDRVVGPGRLPSYSDLESLPYVEAVYKEVLRWYPALPLGIPHMLEVEQDDVYNGMLIPRGSLVMPNVYAMARDPNTYKQPELFKPERFVAEDGGAETNPEKFVFGFGRRRCPGVHVAHSSVWLSIALILSVYDITPHIGSDGKPELPSLHYVPALIAQPEPFKCTIKPRSEAAKKLIRDLAVII